MNNQLIIEHDIETLDDAPSGLDTNPMCEIHFKPIDFYCVTCQLKICSNCAFHKHRPHDIQSLEVHVRISLYDNILFSIIIFKNICNGTHT